MKMHKLTHMVVRSTGVFYQTIQCRQSDVYIKILTRSIITKRDERW